MVAGAYIVYGILKLGQVESSSSSFEIYKPWTLPPDFEQFCEGIDFGTDEEEFDYYEP
jgi:hypothetical protein